MELHQVREYETVEACCFYDTHRLEKGGFLKWISQTWRYRAVEISCKRWMQVTRLHGRKTFATLYSISNNEQR